jgi:uncharacterized protein YbjT (DUF2867 family)
MEGNLKTAIILGATGLTGSLLLKKLIQDDRYSQIRLFSRSTVGFSHPKLKEFLGDILLLEAFKADYKADEVYCCIGTTKAKTPDPEMYKKIDFGIPVSAAALCKSNGIDTFLVVSAMGADPKSRIAYNRLKGNMEESVLKNKIPKIHILRPSLIVGERTEKRFGERVGAKVMKVLDPLLMGSWKKYRSIKADAIAEAMIWLANNDHKEVYIESNAIMGIVGHERDTEINSVQAARASDN